ncbi:MAG: hypothetical protein KKF68_03410 [Nanoarchaeota archaeon]|nr:hypothetical protein [Nanoarchaeota archaeon]
MEFTGNCKQDVKMILGKKNQATRWDEIVGLLRTNEYFKRSLFEEGILPELRGRKIITPGFGYEILDPNPSMKWLPTVFGRGEFFSRIRDADAFAKAVGLDPKKSVRYVVQKERK